MMDFAERLAKERRARLAAERLLEHKSRELFAANEKLALHARSLSNQIVEQREVVRSAIDAAESLKGQQNRFAVDLDRANSQAVLAERRLWESINTFADGFAVFDAELRLVASNRAFGSTAPGLTIEPGLTYSDFFKAAAHGGWRIGEDQELTRNWCGGLPDRLDRKPAEHTDLHLPDGRWLRLIERRAGGGDVVCLLQDITAEKRIWAAIEAIPEAFVLFDREERLLACNQNYRDMFPDSAPLMAPGVSFEELLRFGLANSHVAEAMGREEDWLAERLEQMRTANGTSVCQLADGRWIEELDHRTPDGGRVGLRRDITVDKEREVALEQARTAAEAANRAKSAFLANMSHEIRTPMNGVVGMAELLCDTGLTDEQRLFAETIRSSGEALLVIINDILDYSKIEAERLTLYPEPFDLERTIHEVTMLLQPKARANGINLLIDYDMFLPTRFMGDPGRMRQILTNLIGNAVKFTQSGHVLTRVVGLEDDAGQQQLHVTVEDTGIGIAPENLGAIFGEFNQVESQANRKFEGTGLGLAITQRLIQRMGGEVWVDSEFGKGSVFGFRLTLPAAEEAEIGRLPITLKRALVVDDNFINRTILERQLVPCGIEVVLCRTGAEALESLREGAFDVVLTDHDMPEMDGMALTRAIRDAGHRMPILMLSSHVAEMRENPDFPLLAGMLQKPILRADLYRRLQQISGVPETAPVLAPEPEAEVEARPMRVLTAEDNRTNQLVFQKMVRDTQIELVFAGNGREAVELCQSFRPDMIFMDISMPEMDGKDAARAIRALEAEGRGHLPHVPIVALTAHAMDGDAEEILASGIDRYMTKPLRKVSIMETLREFCPNGALYAEIAPEPDQMTGT